MRRLLCSLALAAALSACGDEGPATPSDIVIAPNLPRVFMGDTEQLTATVVDAEAGDVTAEVEAKSRHCSSPVPSARAPEPAGVAEKVVNGWARRFERLLIHLDVDVLDFADMPLAENTRRNVGLKFPQLVAAVRVLLSAPNWTGLTVCELNPDHGTTDGSTLGMFVAALSEAIAAAPRLQRRSS